MPEDDKKKNMLKKRPKMSSVFMQNIYRAWGKPAAAHEPKMQQQQLMKRNSNDIHQLHIHPQDYPLRSLQHSH